MKQRIKAWIFRLLGKDPEAVVVTFHTGPAELCRPMEEEVRRLVPDRRHFSATPENWPDLRRQLKRYRIFIFSHDHPHPPHVHFGRKKRFSS